MNQNEKNVLRENAYIAILEGLIEGFMGDLEIVGRGTKGLVFVANRGKDVETFAELKIVVKHETFDGFEDVEIMREKMEAQAEKAKTEKG